VIWTILGTIGVVIATVIAGLLADRTWGLVPRKERLAPPPRPALPAHAPGEAPSTAIPATPAEIDLLRRSQRCCRAVMESLTDDEVAFGGSMLGILHVRCARCGSTKSIYVQRLVE
jgi:hypothetical protein